MTVTRNHQLLIHSVFGSSPEVENKQMDSIKEKGPTIYQASADAEETSMIQGGQALCPQVAAVGLQGRDK